jgi:hypothetical protein
MVKKILLVLFLLLPLTVARAVDAPLLISEIQITGGTDHSRNDYIKIYNNTDNAIDLNGYRLVKRTANADTDDIIYSWDNSTPFAARGFYLWANSEDIEFVNLIQPNCSSTSTISTNNSIAIRKGVLDPPIDAISWGTTSTNSLGLNHHISIPSSGKITIFTPPADNPPANNPAPVSGGNPYCQAMKGDVLINEFLSSPGEDEEEWVELINNCSRTVNLEGWTLEDGTGTKTTLSGTFDQYFVIDAPKGKLNNTGDLIILKNSSGQIIDEVVYGAWQERTGPKAPATGQSLARDTNTHEFVLCAKPTKGSANVIEPQEEAEKITTAKTTATSSPIIISEILPNPIGADNEGEFIELFNQSPQTITLQDWRLTNEAGQIFIFSSQTIAPTTSAAFFKITTGLSLNNDRETVKLYAPNNKTAGHSVSYKNAPDGQSYLYDVNEKSWHWSLGATPHQTNILIRPNTEPTAIFYAPESAEINEQVFLDGSDSFDPFSSPLTFWWDFGDKATSTLNAVEHVWKKAGTFTIKLTVSDGDLSNTKEAKIKIIDPRALPELAIAKQVAPQTTANNSLLKISAIVVTPPGLFGTQWFYAMPLDDAGKATNAVVQIYNNKKEFPALKIGDLIEAQGELYAITDDTRLKTKAATDITVLEHDNILVEKTVAIADLNKNLANELITVSGRVAKQQGSNIILSDNGKELLVELKTNTKLRAKDFTPEASYQITGLLKQAGDQLKLWPRYSDDILLLDTAQILGDKITASNTAPTATINFVSNKNKEKTLEYLLITALGLIIGLSVLLFKLKKSPTE